MSRTGTLRNNSMGAKKVKSLSRAPLVAIWIVAMGVAAGCGGARDSRYRFEEDKSAIFRTSGAASSTSPQVGVSPSGELFVLGVFGEETNRRLGLAISHDMGDTFESPVIVSEPNASIRAAGEGSPSLGVTSTAIYALWEQSLPTGGSDLLFAREAFPGKPFQKPIQLTDKTQPSFNGFSSMAIAPNGDVLVVWLDGRSPTGMHGTFSVYLARSTDRGMSFGPNVLVATGACPCCRPRVTVGENGDVYVFWRQVFQGQIRDMVAAVSRDHGATFDSRCGWPRTTGRSMAVRSPDWPPQVWAAGCMWHG